MANMMKQVMSFFESNLTIIIVFLFGIIALTMYSQTKSVDGMSGIRSESNDDENRNIKKILKAPKEETKVKKNATSTESSILNRIRK